VTSGEHVQCVLLLVNSAELKPEKNTANARQDSGHTVIPYQIRVGGFWTLVVDSYQRGYGGGGTRLIGLNPPPRAEAIALMNREKAITRERMFLGALEKAYSRDVILWRV